MKTKKKEENGPNTIPPNIETSGSSEKPPDIVANYFDGKNDIEVIPPKASNYVSGIDEILDS